MFVYNEIKRQVDCLSEINYSPPFKLPKFLDFKIAQNVYKYKFKITNERLKELGFENIAQLGSMKLQHGSYYIATFLLFKNLLKYRCEVNSDLYKDINSQLLVESIRK